MEATRRVSALRREVGAIRTVPFRIIGDGAGFLAGWSVGSVQRQLGRHDVEKQGGRKPEAATGFCAHGGLFAPMVAGRQANRVLWASSGRTLANLYGAG